MTGERYVVISHGREWWVKDTMGHHILGGWPGGIVNKYTYDARDRAEEVAAHLNSIEAKKRGGGNG